MATVKKISIALTQELSAIVRQAVESGEYASASEVIRDALRDWKLKRAIQQEQIEELSRLWREGVESGEAVPFDLEEIKQEGRRRRAAGLNQPVA